MLKYKVKLNEPKGYNEIKYDELYLSPDLSFISGITDYNYELVDGQPIKIEFNEDNNFHDAIINIENVTRQGYVLLKQKFKVEEYKNFRGFQYIDGKYYFCEKSGATINMYGKNVEIVSGFVETDVTYWIENGKLTIGENTYDVDIQLNKDGDAISPKFVSIKGGKNLVVNNSSKENWKLITKFYIRKNNDYLLKLNDASCAKKVPYFLYNEGNITKPNDSTVMNKYVNKKFYLTYDKVKKEYTCEIGDKIFTQNCSVVSCGNEEYNLEYEWRNSSNGNFLHIFLQMPQYKFTSAQKILVESTTSIKTKCDIQFTGSEKNNDGYIIYCGKRYNESEDTIDFVKIGNEEYLLTYVNIAEETATTISDTTEDTSNNNTSTEDTSNNNTSTEDSRYGYIIFNDKQILFKVGSETAEKVLQYNKNSNSGADNTKVEYNIIKYHYVKIDDDIFLVKNYKKISTETDIEYVEVFRKEKFKLTIIDTINNSMLRCVPDVGEDGDISGICEIISSNYKNMEFKLLNPIFEEHNVLKESFILAIKLGEEEVFDKIRLFNPSYYIKFPLSLGNDMAANLRQEDILENIFFKEEEKKSINPYVDMEREIYYPCFFNESNNTNTNNSNDDKYKLINEIIFDLHFRSRNLEDWKINDDVFSNAKKDTNNNSTSTTHKCNWNIFDYYKNYDDDDDDEGSNSIKPEISANIINNEFKYYQPADLLYFLNFTTDDVFYQKSKIGKSFLRLLFFDNNDVANQTLLYSCVVFMNENKLYKTYIDNIIKKDNHYVSVSEEMNETELSYSTNIGVYNDTCVSDSDYNVTFEKDKRLATTFSVKNRYEAEESAEGFYLHIFKDFCEKLHEKTIYMKIEFNHAGEGRTINFTMPFKYDDNGNVELLDLSPDSDDLTEFKKGYPMKELYERLFIPINVVYDDKNNRYVYYLPNGLVKNNDKQSIMKFNLYEIKIKDESNKETESNNESNN